MSQDRPSLKPEWANDPPVAPPTTITEPTSTQKAHGWQPAGSVAFAGGKPVRQIMNWLQNLYQQWVQWFDQTTFRPSDFLATGGIPGTGSVPTTGSGLAIAASNFSSSAYVNGYRVDAASSLSPAYTYTASRDTYWDVARTGTWTATAVTNGAGAPAVASNSVRCFKLVTDATNRTSVVDLRTALVATFGTVNATTLAVSGNATITGDLTVDDITADAVGGVSLAVSTTAVITGDLTLNEDLHVTGDIIGSLGIVAPTIVSTSSFYAQGVPASPAAVAENRIYGLNVVKAACSINISGGSPALGADPFNVASIAADATSLTITFGGGTMANSGLTGYTAIVSIGHGTGEAPTNGVGYQVLEKNTGSLKLKFIHWEDGSPGTLNPTSGASMDDVIVDVLIIGKQT